MKHTCLAICALGLGLGCLPGDDRPEPGSLLARAGSSPAVTDGFTTDDGWRVTFDRFVTAIGDLRLRDYPEDSGACNDYAETYYEWLFDFTEVNQPQKVGLVFGLGTCSVEYRVRAPSDETVLGIGATEADLTLMRIEASDAYEENEGISLLALGRGERDGVKKRFQWVFRRTYEIEECDAADGGLANVVQFSGGVASVLDLEVRGEELFRQAPSDEAAFAFDPIAEADADEDGEITLAELTEVEVAFDETMLPEGLPPEAFPATLADLVYEHLLARVVRVAGGGSCQVEIDEH